MYKHFFLALKLILFLISGVLLYQNATSFFPFLSDDALISFRYSLRFAQGEGLTWNPGERVEGYSNLLWVLILAIPAKLGWDLVTASRVLGFLFCLLIPGILFFNLKKDQLLAGCFASFFFVLSGSTGAWSIGGLEQASLASLLFVSTFLFLQAEEKPELSVRHALLLGFFPALICISRPDGPLFALLSAAWFAWIQFTRNGWKDWKIQLAPFLLPALFIGGQLIFRIQYYGEWVPNTALVKIAPSAEHFQYGLGYLKRFLLAHLPFSAFAIVFLVAGFWLTNTRKTFLLLAALSFSWMGYLVFIGGDIFPGFRHGLVLVALFTLILERGLSMIRLSFLQEKYKPSGNLLLLILFSGSVEGMKFIQNDHVDFVNARNENWEWQCVRNGKFLKKHFGETQPLIAVTAAGATPFFSELPAIDMLGLNDYYIAHHPPKDAGKGFIGHEFGDGKYVMERNPDILIFHTGNEKDMGRSAREMQEMPEFYEKYSAVFLHPDTTLDEVSVFWMSRVNPKTGVLYQADSVVIPAWHFAGKTGPFLREGTNGKAVIRLEKGEKAICILPKALERTNWKSLNTPYAFLDGKEGHAVSILNTSDHPLEIEKVILVRDSASIEKEDGIISGSK